MITFNEFIEQQKNTLEFKTEKAKFDFIFNVKKAMLAQGMTQAELAKKIGTSTSYISKVLQCDHANFTIESMVKICSALGGDFETRISIGQSHIDKETRYNHEKSKWVSDNLNEQKSPPNRYFMIVVKKQELWQCSQY